MKMLITLEPLRLFGSNFVYLCIFWFDLFGAIGFLEAVDIQIVKIQREHLVNLVSNFFQKVGHSATYLILKWFQRAIERNKYFQF